MSTISTSDPGKTTRQITTVQILINHLGNNSTVIAIPAFEPLRIEADKLFEMLLDKLVEL